VVDPSIIIARYHRATLLIDLARHREALPDVEQLLALSPEAASRSGLFNGATMAKVNLHAIALMLHARIYARLKNFDGAERDFKASLAEERSSETLMWFGSMLDDSTDRREEALAYLREAAALAPRDYNAHYFYGLALWNNRYFEEAVEQYDAAIRIGPYYARAYMERAVTLRSLGQVERAEHDLEIAFQVAIWSDDKYVFGVIMSNLRLRSYWTKAENPHVISAELRDSLTACVVDPHCI
jgi:tetratricopeptide (TPR) repeat protein